MKQSIIAFLIVIFCPLVKAQDSTQQVLNHEIGFNTVSLIKQMISNNPGAALQQLPYDIFYNLYYMDKVGLRLGLGYDNSKTDTEVFGQQTPRSSKDMSLNLRAGVSYNFVKARRITFNAFADVVSESLKSESVTTFTTSQGFPNTPKTVIITATDKTSGIGAQVGVGVKYNIYRHLSIYAEVPVTFMSEKQTSDSVVSDSSFGTTSSTTSKNSSVHIFLPTTVYLVLRF